MEVMKSMRVGYNPKKGRIKTDSGITIDRAFLAHYQVSAANAVAADSDGVLPLTNLSAAAQVLTSGFLNPAVPRNLQIDGNVSGINGKVKITGTNYAGKEISEEITANGTTVVEGALAFKTITKIELPVQVHTPVKQIETATATGTVTTAGNASVTVTSALFDEAEVVAVPVALNDDAAAIALAIRTALAANNNIAAHFDVSGEDAAVILTAKLPAANDATLNMSIADGAGDGASVGVTTAASSANTTAGVPYDQISVGWGDKLGLPYTLPHNTVLAAYFDNIVESTDPIVVTDADELEKNTVQLDSALAGKVIDIYFIV